MRERFETTEPTEPSEPETEKLLTRWEMEEKEKQALETRLEKLIGKTVEGFRVSANGEVIILFEDGLELSFESWNAFDDQPGLEYVEVRSPEKTEKNE